MTVLRSVAGLMPGVQVCTPLAYLHGQTDIAQSLGKWLWSFLKFSFAAYHVWRSTRRIPAVAEFEIKLLLWPFRSSMRWHSSAVSVFSWQRVLLFPKGILTISPDAFESAALISSLVPDYRFLEDTGRFADGATRDGLVRTPRTTSKVSPGFTG